MSQKIGNIEIFMGPQTVGGPDDLRQTIIDFIDGSKKRLYIAVQELDCMDIANAIIRARQRKVTVKVVLEGSYLKVDRARRYPFEREGQNEINREIYNALLRANIDVKSDYNPYIFHQKFIIRDGKALLTGSTNFTDTGTSTNLNHLVLIHDKKVAKIYGREFREIQQGHFGKLDEGHDPVPDEETVSGVPVKILFAPDHNPEMEIMKQMAKAQKSIDFAIFTFSKSSGIDDQMVALANSLQIRGVLDDNSDGVDWAVTHELNQANIQIKIVSAQGNLRKLHHKLMIIDRQVVIAGSFNYTGPANKLNDENIIILGDLGSSASSRNKQKALAGYALTEIDRIYNNFGRDF